MFVPALALKGIATVPAWAFEFVVPGVLPVLVPEAVIVLTTEVSASVYE
jgi:hypothetical protein